MLSPNEKWNSRQLWLRFALPVSVVLNIFLIAIFVGQQMHRNGYSAGTGGTTLTRALANAEASLPASDAAAFGSVMRSNKAHYHAAAADLAAARSELEKQVASENFDSKATKQALANWRQAWNRFFDDFEDTLVEALAKVSPAGRRRLIEERRKGLVGTNPNE
jgi:uncharacterized membrane protein